jgi:membrane protease YdiL (CAAX protease family)
VVISIERHQALSSQTTTLYAPVDTHPYLDLAYQLVGIATELAPVLLVIYLLHRSSERLSVLGIDPTQPRRDAAWGAVLAALVGGVGLGALLAYKALGFNLAIDIGSTHHYWFTAPLLVLHAAGTATAEEVIVGSYLLYRLEQMEWSQQRSLAAAALIRGAYHLYQGPGQFVSNVVLGLFFGRIFQRTRRAAPLVLAHFLIDAVAFVGYLELKGKVGWLP